MSEDSVIIVVIGRNEGPRLDRCLHSARAASDQVMYVDSGSTDDSLAIAHRHGVEAVELDLAQPFTMARARNFGHTESRRRWPHAEFVQFLDGDCQLQPGWLAAGLMAMTAEPAAAVVSGRRRELDPTFSIFNRLVDLEWDTPLGWVDECHGDALMRVDAFDQVGGFCDEMIAGEEPELCVRLRSAGHRILRIDEEMSLHDAAMSRPSQWARRTTRSGHALADLVYRHGVDGNRAWSRRLVGQWVWALLLPATVVAAVAAGRRRAMWALLIYPLHVLKIAMGLRHRTSSWGTTFAYAASVVIGRWLELLGQLRFVARRALGQPARLIEYKGPERDGAGR